MKARPREDKLNRAMGDCISDSVAQGDTHSADGDVVEESSLRTLALYVRPEGISAECREAQGAGRG